jgi:phosphoribosyl 1,2-cyclic phosphodiesterase
LGLKVTVLGSGSAGNLTVVEGSKGCIAIEMGLSAREAARRMEAAGVDPGKLDGILVSHEHGDHVKGARVFSRRHGVPVYTSRETAQASRLEAAELAGLVEVAAGSEFELAGMEIKTFSLPHDAVDTVGYVVADGGSTLGYATDMGFPSALASERLRGCEILVIEANHDPEMLRWGPYPPHVKQRVAGRAGHLSNEQSVELLRQVVTDSTQAVFLAHLSEQNNDSRMAFRMGKQALRGLGRDQVQLELTFQERASIPAQV